MVKKPSQQAIKRPDVTPEQAEALAQKLADKPYGEKEKPELVVEEKQSRTTISLPTSLLHELEDLALQNKRDKMDPRSVSALVREALQQYLKTKES